MTLSELSLRNARRQAGDYLVYFVTMIMAVALMYAFNGLIFSRELLTLCRQMEALPVTIVLASIVIVCIIAWLVQYTTGFMFARRSREFGTYVLIGLENNQVARLFFLENLAVGAASLLLGILSGNLIYQALRAMILAMFGMRYYFSFAFSLRAAALTLFYFLLIYLLAQQKIRKRIRKMKIYDLIYFERKNEEEMISKSKNRRRIFSVSIVLGIAGTLLLTTRNLPLGIIGAACVIVFLYGFFASFSSGVPAFFDKRPQKKYQGQNLMVFRTLSAKLATMGVVMATIALLFTAVQISQGTGLIIKGILDNRARQSNCFDIFIAVGEKGRNVDDYRKYIEKNIPLAAAHNYFVYQGDNMQMTDYVEENADYYRNYDYDIVMKYSDYAILRKMLGYSEVSLSPGKYLIHCQPYLKKLLEDYGEAVTLGGNTYYPGGVWSEDFNQYAWEGNGRGFLLIVPDEAVENRPVVHTMYAAMTREAVSEAQAEALDAMNGHKEYDTLYIKTQIERETAANTAAMVFPLCYLALILTMTAAAILTIQQLSEAAHYRSQFVLLRKLGMDRARMEKVLRRQFAIYYAMPAIPPLFVSIPFILALGGNVEPGVMVGTSHPVVILGITLGLFFLIYFIYIAMAYGSMRRNVLPAE